MSCCWPISTLLTSGLVQGGDRQLTCAGGEGRPKTGPSPVDRAKPGSKHHLICGGNGIPLAVTLTGGNRNDVTQLMPLPGAIPPVRGKVGRPRQRPPRYTPQLGTGRPPAGGRAEHRLAPLVPAAAHPLGDPR